MKLHIITPVKNSFGTTIRTIESIVGSEGYSDLKYTIYNDFSDDETTFLLQEAAVKYDIELVHLKTLTTHPSPNYRLVLQLAQKKALAENAHLIIVESDVVIEPRTIQKMMLQSAKVKNPGLIAAVTTGETGEINFPYLFARNFRKGTVETGKRLSFCCTLLTNRLLNTYDFTHLDPQKTWYDIFISHNSTGLGFKNYLLTNVPVLHLPHSSRPWKMLKYTNPLKYYWQKYTKGLDKI